MNAFSLPEEYTRRPNPRILEATIEPSEPSHKPPCPVAMGEKHNFLLIEILSFVACGALTVFSFYSSALEYLNNLGNAHTAGIRTIGIQLGIIVFGALAVMQLFTVRRVSGLTRMGCVFGSITSVLLTAFLFADSASTSYSYQDYKLRKRTAPERQLEASIHQYDADVSRLQSRFENLLTANASRRANLMEEKARLDAIVGPAVKAGTNLKKGYSDALATVTSELASNATATSRLKEEEHRQLTRLDMRRSEESAKLRASNSSGASNVGRMFGISTSTVLMLRTGMCEAALVALAVMFGVGLFYASNSTKQDRMRNYGMSAFHASGFLIIFGIAWALFMAEAATGSAIPLDAPLSNMKPSDNYEPDDDMWDVEIQTELMPLPYTDDPVGLPQAASFPSWDFEQMGDGNGLKMDAKYPPKLYCSARKEQVQPVAISAISTAPAIYPQGCPIPEDVWTAINDMPVSSKVKGILGGFGEVESRWDVNCHHYDNHGGYSHGWLQLHGKWRKKDVDWMKRLPGGWRCPKNNLAAFLRTIIEHQKYYPSSKHSWMNAAAHYNGGSKPNYKYANKVMSSAKRLEQWFQSQGRMF